MNRKILWVEDDYYAIKGLVRPLENAHFKVDVAISAKEAYDYVLKWQEYDLIVLDVIVTITDDEEPVMPEIAKWVNNDEYAGIAMAKWLLQELKIACPILLMSVVNDPVTRFGLTGISNLYYLSKKGLLPSLVKEKVFGILNLKE
jgi:CheY-like chemotaxis protein